MFVYSWGTYHITAAVTVSAGTSHSLAIRNDGTTWSWGSNWNGELGIRLMNPNYSSIPLRVIDEDLGRETIAVVAGDGRSLAIGRAGTHRTIYGWGIADCS